MKHQALSIKEQPASSILKPLDIPIPGTHNMNMFRINVQDPPGIGVRRLLLAAVAALNALVVAAGLLILALGREGVFCFLCTWPVSALVGFVLGGLFLPDPKPAERRTA